jgi:hypothetical protein
VGAFDVVCPPVTTGVCTGRIVIRRRAGHGKLAALRFEAVPGSYQALRFELSAALSALLRRTHRIGLTATLAAHDGARHPHHKTRVERLTLVLAKGAR